METWQYLGSDMRLVVGRGFSVEVMNKYELVPSMSRRGNCYDNAVAEIFFSTLKTNWSMTRTSEHSIRLVEQSSNTLRCSITAIACISFWATNLPAIMKGCKLLLKPLSAKSGLPQGVSVFLLRFFFLAGCKRPPPQPLWPR